jgi:hypothetical protein
MKEIYVIMTKYVVIILRYLITRPSEALRVSFASRIICSYHV